METEEEEVKREATEPEKDRAVRTLGLRRRRSPEQLVGVFDQLSMSLSGERNWWGKPRFQNSLGLSPIKHMLSDIDLSNLEILRQVVGSFSYQPHDEILNSIAAFFPDLLKSLALSDRDVHRLLPYLASRNTQRRPLTELQANNNRLENLAPSVFRQDDSMNDNDVNQLVVYTAEAEQLLDAGESSRSRETLRWTLLMTNLILEIASAVFDQMGYALIGMVLAFVALLLAAVELIHVALKERIKWAGKRPILPLSHLRSTYTSATRKPVGTIVEYFGLAGAAWQCVYSTVEYTYTRQDKDNPIKICLLPFIFLLCVVIFKLLVDKRSIDESS
ncbi:hypothetical protein POTOM_003624 [Populus tomentosa]|uniref:Uncharacterized protein n=1 Tax=Populus tomentosa TaxID=118781 RepID=A0A8X8ADV3_POPTO|nr:hypothetical protein POTOM_003624 [Populus tomentosa]